MVMTNELLVRLAHESDAQKIAAVVRGGFPGYPFGSVYDSIAVGNEIVAEHAKELGARRVVCHSKAEGIIGTAVLGEGSMSEVKRVVVSPEHRGNGAASLMTSYLAKIAYDQWRSPWADARSSEPNMQRAAIKAGMNQAISAEVGKHTVYVHSNGYGPARETMVHMSSILMSDKNFLAGVRLWPKSVRQSLVNELARVFDLPRSDEVLSLELLPSAGEVKNRICNKLGRLEQEDVVDMQIGGSRVLVITPDASAFIEETDGEDLDSVVGVLFNAGVQVVTSYTDTSDMERVLGLVDQGFVPSMMRLWKNDLNQPAQVQVGMRQTTGEFDRMLYLANLSGEAENQIGRRIKMISNL